MTEAPPKKRKNSRAKGANAERELLTIFKFHMEQVEDELRRNNIAFPTAFSEEARRTAKPMFSVGEDFAGIPFLSIECKFVEANLIDKHWEQCLRQCKGRRDKFPVLFSKKAHRGWRVRSYVSLQYPLQTDAMLWVVADYSVEDFMLWFKIRYRQLLVQSGEASAGKREADREATREAGSWITGSGKPA